jgi:putative serine protease PepD
VVSIEVTFPGGRATGSGFVIGADGLILTNNHVIAEALTRGRIEVVFADGSQERAEIVGHTTPYDLAVLRVDRSGLPVLEFADSDSVRVGDPVVAVGAPLGLESTVTAGIVSALNRPVSAGAGEDSAFINAIQTDAAINPGNSGGPLVDLSGRVIGVNSAIARAPGTGPEGGNIGLGFAIPSDQAVRTAQELIDTGKATYPIIGVLLDRNHSGEGVKVVEEADAPEGQPIITPGGPADKAGIRPGDLIVEFEGRPVTDPDELIVAIRAQRPGDTVTLTVRRGDEEREVRLTLDKAESD